MSTPTPEHPYGGVPNIERGINVVIGAAAAKAGFNHYEQTDDKAQAITAGLGALVRWTVWALVFIGWWTLVLVSIIDSGLAVSFSGSASAEAASNSHMATLAACFVIAPWMLGVTWVRNIDYCLFRRGLIYRFYAPIARMVEWCPSAVLYLLIIIPWFVV